MSERLAELIVQECIQQLEIGKKCDPYTGELFTCEHNDNIDYQIEVLKDHFEIGLLKFFQTPVHANDMSEKHVQKSEKNEHEWVGLTEQEKGWCAAPTYEETIERVEAKLKEKNT